MQNYLRPTHAGVRFAVASLQQDSLRFLLCRLISCQNSTTADLEQFIDQQHFDSRKAVGVALYKLQGLGLIASTEQPIEQRDHAFDDAMAHALARLSADGCGVLAEHDGLVVAYSGFRRELAMELAAAGTNMLPMGARITDDHDEDNSQPWEITVNKKGRKITFMRLHIGQRTLLLASGEIDDRSDGFRQLITLLMTRYLANLL